MMTVYRVVTSDEYYLDVTGPSIDIEWSTFLNKQRAAEHVREVFKRELKEIKCNEDCTFLGSDFNGAGPSGRIDYIRNGKKYDRFVFIKDINVIEDSYFM